MQRGLTPRNCPPFAGLPFIECGIRQVSTMRSWPRSASPGGNVKIEERAMADRVELDGHHRGHGGEDLQPSGESQHSVARRPFPPSERGDGDRGTRRAIQGDLRAPRRRVSMRPVIMISTSNRWSTCARMLKGAGISPAAS